MIYHCICCIIRNRLRIIAGLTTFNHRLITDRLRFMATFVGFSDNVAILDNLIWHQKENTEVR